MVSFGLGLGGFYGFPLVSFGFQGRNKGKGNPRKTQTNQGNSEEAINP
jgi:glucose/arabinose dehydrogenase